MKNDSRKSSGSSVTSCGHADTTASQSSYSQIQIKHRTVLENEKQPELSFHGIDKQIHLSAGTTATLLPVSPVTSATLLPQSAGTTATSFSPSAGTTTTLLPVSAGTSANSLPQSAGTTATSLSADEVQWSERETEYNADVHETSDLTTGSVPEDHDGGFERTSVPEDHGDRSETTSVPEDHDGGFQRITVPEDHGGRSEMTSVPEDHDGGFERTTVPEDHDGGFERTTVPEDHDGGFERTTVPEDHDGRSETTSVSEDHDGRFEMTSVLEDHGDRSETTSVPEDHDGRSEMTTDKLAAGDFEMNAVSIDKSTTTCTASVTCTTAEDQESSVDDFQTNEQRWVVSAAGSCEEVNNDGLDVGCDSGPGLMLNESIVTESVSSALDEDARCSTMSTSNLSSLDPRASSVVSESECVGQIEGSSEPAAPVLLSTGDETVAVDDSEVSLCHSVDDVTVTPSSPQRHVTSDVDSVAENDSLACQRNDESDCI